jgi:hypothetical protein
MPVRRRVVIALVALAVPPVLIAAALLVLAHAWTADVSYALPGFPEPRIELAGDERSRLAAIGVRAIQPWRADGIQAMREARHAHGAPAFAAEEIRHFEDVRGVVTGFLVLGAAGLMIIAAALAAPRARPLVGGGLRAGAKTTLGAFAALSVLMLAGFGAFFDGFHAVFFEGDSWRLPRRGTVRSLFPDAFWAIMGAAMAALALAQAAAILLALRVGPARGRGT